MFLRSKLHLFKLSEKKNNSVCALNYVGDIYFHVLAYVHNDKFTLFIG